MTEVIKQWITDRAENSFMFEQPTSYIDIYTKGLTKGIEIAEGFDLWKIKIGAIQRITGYYTVPDSNKPYSFSQLLEKYIQQLGK